MLYNAQGLGGWTDELFVILRYNVMCFVIPGRLQQQKTRTRNMT